MINTDFLFYVDFFLIVKCIYVKIECFYVYYFITHQFQTDISLYSYNNEHGI